MMISSEGTDESSLSDGTAKLSIRTVIGQFPLLKSIFRLFQEKSIFRLLSINTKKYLIVHPLWRKVTSPFDKQNFTYISGRDVFFRFSCEAIFGREE